jgi:SNF2 family DNA or RNA helicase
MPKTTPFKHQREVLKQSWDEPGFGLLMEMGTGKSKITVDNICMLAEVEGLTHALIFAPKGAYSNWTKKEIPAHMPIRHRSRCLTHMWQGGGTKTEQRQLERMLAKDDLMRVLVVNTEAVSMSDKVFKFILRYLRVGKCYTAVDESSGIKNPSAIRSKQIHKLRDLSEWRRILTGTPITRNPLDLWSQFEFLNSRCLGHGNYYNFRARYAVLEEVCFDKREERSYNDADLWEDKKGEKGKTVKIVVGHKNTEELARRVAEYAFVVKKEDCLDLPPKIYQTREVKLTDDQRRMYSEMLQFTTSELGKSGSFVTATIAITLYMKLNQIICGYVRDESGMMHEVPTNRVDELESIVEETAGRNIIWCQYRNDVDRVMARLKKMGRVPVEFHGGMSQRQCDEAIFRFQGEYDGKRCLDSQRATDFVSTISKGYAGITLTAANVEIYYSCGPDAEKRWQSEDRAHRIGQTQSVTIIDMIAPGTVEEKNAVALINKKCLADMILDGPARVREFFS